MKQVAALVASVTIMCSAACAQGIPVLSGEHENFTRIVIDFSRPTEWAVTREPEGYRVTFSPPPGRLDLSRLFDLIPRDRLEHATQSPQDGSLFLYSSCDCTIEAFDAGSDAVALDIADAPESRPARSVFSLPAGLTVETTAAPRTSPLPFALPNNPVWNGGAIRTTEPEEAAGPDDRPLPRPEARGADARPNLAAGQPALLEDFSGEAQARALAQALIDDLERAADAGLIDFSGQRTLAPDARRAPRDGAEPAEFPRHEQKQVGTKGNLRLRTAHDRWSNDLREILRREESCLSPEALGFFRADEPRRLLERLPDLRASLVDARGTVSANGARALAKAYLALGFGAEAAVVLRDADLPDLWAARFESLARIVDDGEDSDIAAWSGASACPSPIALWATLGQAPGLPTDAVDAAAVQTAFFELPAHLRLRLAESLAHRLHAAGHRDAAGAIVANADRLRLPPPILAEGGEAAEAALPERALAAEPPIAPGAQEVQVHDLLGRVGRALAAGLAPDEEDLDLADALLKEYEGTTEGRRLADILALRHLQSADIEAALTQLARTRADPDAKWTAAIEDGLGTALLAQPVSTLLETTLHPRAAELLGILSDEQRTRAAERLLEAGFPQAAAQLMRLSEPGAGPAGRMITARAAFEAGDAARTLALLAGRSEPRAAALRAEALAALGNHRGAAEAFAEAGDLANAARSAWLSGDATLIASFGTPEHREAMARLGQLDAPSAEADEEGSVSLGGTADAAPAANEATPAAPEPGSLAAAASLLERSAARRAMIEGIIGAAR